ncbi:MAG TPA: SWIM zinc finger family protein [Candidatus Dormibacteraeota bacterium]|jgi:uncharacterized Zn finger protein|nr:SWIM zinc finger family protein [Candidatus Dormibacteraeota bacterium]
MTDFRSWSSGPRRTEGGIRARSQRGAIGESWWSKRFLSVLESFDYGPRLARGRNYARRGQVLELRVNPGRVDASVQGSRVRPYQVRLEVTVLSEAEWDRAEAAMAERALFAAKLLAGEIPPQIEEVFDACGLTLFPRASGELASSCSCPDHANPCKHVAAAFYLLAETFDDDPFLVFAWRGRTRERLMEGLRAWQDGDEPPAVLEMPQLPEPPPLEECLSGFYEMGPVTGAIPPPRAAETPDALIRQMGRVGVRAGRPDLAELLGPLYAALARAAEERGLG